MKKSVQAILWIASFAGVGYYFRAPIGGFITRLENAAQPCSSPIHYSIGEFDKQFGISQSSFLSALSQAEAIWEKSIGKQLFAYTTDGALKINLIYDYRQQATQKLQTLGITVADTRASYDTMKAQYASLLSQYQTGKAAYEAKVADFNQREAAYNQEVQQWNARGGAPKGTYEQLEAQRQALRVETEQINQERDVLTTEVDNVNALAVSLNQVATNLNLNVARYNEIGASRGEEFDEGMYRSSPTGQEIDIYQYDTQVKLVRVLAHELGHALGLQHVEDAKAIMYRLNSGTNEKLTATDMTQLKTLCGI